MEVSVPEMLAPIVALSIVGLNLWLFKEKSAAPKCNKAMSMVVFQEALLPRIKMKSLKGQLQSKLFFPFSFG